MRLSTTYKTKEGDTLESISRRVYGTENEADKLARANPDLVGEPSASIELITPKQPATLSAQPASNIDEVALMVDGVRFRFWDSMKITRSIDMIDTVNFGAPLDLALANFKESFVPMSFKPANVIVGGESLFAGTLVNSIPNVDSSKKTIQADGYATAGVLNDCMPSSTDYPIEFNNQGLRDIATKLAEPFGIPVIFEFDQGAIFERVACKPDQNILDFLAGLAKQRNLVISSTDDGKLLFTRAIEGSQPVARLAQGQSPVTDVESQFSPQNYYSHITAIEPVSVGHKGSKYTVKNERLKGVLRPFTFVVEDTKSADVKAAAEAKAGRMFANMVSYSVAVATWRDPQGALWKPNTIVTLIAPDAMIFKEYSFLIRSVVFEAEATSRTAVLNLVLPDSFNGKIPKVLPWE